jgi:hypothetical protein
MGIVFVADLAAITDLLPPVAARPAIQLDQESAIMVREPDETIQPVPQDNQLMSKRRVLSFKPQL